MALTKVSGSILKDPLNLGEVSIGGTLTYQDVTNVDSVGVITARTDINLGDSIIHNGDADTKISFPADNTISFDTAGSTRFGLSSSGNIELHGTQTGNNVATIYNGTGFLGFYASSNSGVNRDFRFFSSNSNSNESLRIASNGSVIIGKTSNQGKGLEIYQNARMLLSS